MKRTIKVNQDVLEDLVRKSSSTGPTIPGVQKKLSLHLSDDDSDRLTIVGHPAGYILKPQSGEFKQLPEAEDLAMDTAEMMGVKTVPHGWVEIDGEKAFISKRVDRSDKEHSTRIGFDLSEFFLRLVVCFLTGNSDMHFKSFSPIEKTPGERDFELSPAYDFLPVNVVFPEDKEETALTLNGKNQYSKKGFFCISGIDRLKRKVRATNYCRCLKIQTVLYRCVTGPVCAMR